MVSLKARTKGWSTRFKSGYVNLLYCLWNIQITFESCDRQSQSLGSRELITLVNNQFTDQSSQPTLTITDWISN